MPRAKDSGDRAAPARAGDAAHPPRPALPGVLFEVLDRDATGADRLTVLANGQRLAAAVHTVAHLDIAGLLADGPRSVNSLAASAGCHAPSLYRVLRCLALCGIFREGESGQFALTPPAQLLRSDRKDSLRDVVLFDGSAEFARTLAAMDHSVRTGEPAPGTAHGGSFRDRLRTEGTLRALYERVTAPERADAEERLLDHTRLWTSRRCVDIGGDGRFLAEWLACRPHAEGVLTNGPAALATAERTLRERGVRERAVLLEGDPVPRALPLDCDTYVLRTVLRGLPDDAALRTLREVRRFMAGGTAHLLLLEHCVAPANAWDPAKILDLDRLVALGGHERSSEELGRLLGSAGLETVARTPLGTWTLLRAQALASQTPASQAPATPRRSVPEQSGAVAATALADTGGSGPAAAFADAVPPGRRPEPGSEPPRAEPHQGSEPRPGPRPEPRPGPGPGEQRSGPSDYDAFAERYADFADANAYNVVYDRPNMLALAGEVAGLNVLDLGCAAGTLARSLAERGARVSAIDRSRPLVELARRRHGSHVTFSIGDISAPLPFPDAAFDLVTASLVMHYLRDWQPALREVRRCLRPGGAFVMSTQHPGEDWHWFDTPSYFATELIRDAWSMDGRPVEMSFYRRPLSAVFNALRDVGFTVDRLEEPPPAPECAQRFPDEHHTLMTRPLFLFIRATAPGSKDEHSVAR
jgi:SAM-dependent methyltransferase